MNNTTVRDIQLNVEALAICKKHCKGRKPRDYVFTQSNGAPWNQDRLDERFRMIRTLAEVRDEITIYSFRHLWMLAAFQSGGAGDCRGGLCLRCKLNGMPCITLLNSRASPFWPAVAVTDSSKPCASVTTWVFVE